MMRRADVPGSGAVHEEPSHEPVPQAPPHELLRVRRAHHLPHGTERIGLGDR